MGSQCSIPRSLRNGRRYGGTIFMWTPWTGSTISSKSRLRGPSMECFQSPIQHQLSPQKVQVEQFVVDPLLNSAWSRVKFTKNRLAMPPSYSQIDSGWVVCSTRFLDLWVAVHTEWRCIGWSTLLLFSILFHCSYSPLSKNTVLSEALHVLSLKTFTRLAPCFPHWYSKATSGSLQGLLAGSLAQSCHRSEGSSAPLRTLNREASTRLLSHHSRLSLDLQTAARPTASVLTLSTDLGETPWSNSWYSRSLQV